MEDNLKKWQSDWQKQKAKPMQLNEVISRLNNLEQKAKRQRILLFVLLAILFVVSIWEFSEILKEQYNLLSYFLIVSAIAVKLIPNLKGKYNIVENETQLNNRSFVKSLKEKLKFDTTYLVIFLILATLGLNAALLGLYEKGTIFNFDFNSENRVMIHLSTILLFIIGYVIHRKKVMQSHCEISSLINELENDGLL